MGMFSFGGAKSKNKSQSSGQSSSLDLARSGSQSGGFSDSVGGSSSTGRSASGSGSTSSSASQSSDSVAFEDIFARLFGGAEGAAGGLDTSLLTGAANQLFSGGLGFLDSLSGGADTDFLQARMSGESPVLGEQIGALGDDIGSFFRDQILPGITSEAVAGGSLGGGRQGVAEGMATEAAANEFSQGATALRANDIEARDRAAGVLGSNRIAGAQAGLGGLSGLAGIADFGFGADLAPFERLAALLGGPTVLGASSGGSTGRSTSTSTSVNDASSFSESSAEDFAAAFSESFGTSQATNQSTASGSSKAFKLGASGSSIF